MINFRTDEAGNVINVSAEGPLDTITAEVLSLLGLIYYMLTNQSQESADLFADLVRSSVTDPKDGIFTGAMQELAKTAEVEVDHADDV